MACVKRVALVTVGHAPRDDIVPELRRLILPEIALTQAGALDAFPPEAALAELAPVGDEPVMVSRLRNGEMGRFSAAKTQPLLQACIDRCAGEADAVVLLCTNRFEGLTCPVPLLLPFELLHSTAASLAKGMRAAALFPLESHAPQMARWWREAGVELDYVCAPPGQPLDWEAMAARFAGCGLLILDCIGYPQAVFEQAKERLELPVLWPRGLIAGLVNTLS